jgi:hypothetical protein
MADSENPSETTNEVQNSNNTQDAQDAQDTQDEINNGNIMENEDKTSKVSMDIIEQPSEDIEEIRAILNPICKYCNKEFSNKKICDRHVKQQKCIPVHKRTYCKLCDMVFDDRESYSKHQLSEEHFARLDDIEVEKFKMPESEINLVDPFLDKKDINQIKNSSFGNGFTICFKNSDYHAVEFEIEEEGSDTASQTSDSSVQTEDIEIDVEQKFEQEMEERMKPTPLTDRQVKIITFLRKLKDQENADKKFLNAINTKLQLEDFKGLNIAIISDEEISISAKQKYIQVLRVFKNKMQTKYQNGETVHNNMNIIDIINTMTV